MRRSLYLFFAFTLLLTLPACQNATQEQPVLHPITGIHREAGVSESQEFRKMVEAASGKSYVKIDYEWFDTFGDIWVYRLKCENKPDGEPDWSTQKYDYHLYLVYDNDKNHVILPNRKRLVQMRVYRSLDNLPSQVIVMETAAPVVHHTTSKAIHIMVSGENHPVVTVHTPGLSQHSKLMQSKAKLEMDDSVLDIDFKWPTDGAAELDAVEKTFTTSVNSDYVSQMDVIGQGRFTLFLHDKQ